VPPESIGPPLAELAGGAERLAERARGFIETDKPLEALYMLELALAADENCRAARLAKRDALILLDHQTGGRNLWERRWIAAQIQDLEKEQQS
jgi:hypothetical protein